MKKIVAVLLTFTMMCSLFVGCGGETGGNQSQGDDNTANTDGSEAHGDVGSRDNGGVIELSFWVSWGTSEMNKLQVMADDFNNSQSKYHITLTASGGIAEIRSKMSTTKQQNYPSLICGGATTAATYATSDYVAPLQDFIDADTENWTETEGLFPAVRSSYSDRDGRLLGHPIGVSCAGYVVNEDLLDKAGYSLSDVNSFEDIVNISIDAVQKGVCEYGMSFQSGVDLLDMLTIQGVGYVDNGNGYSGDATKSLLLDDETHEAVKKAVSLFASVYENNAAYPYGDGSEFTAFHAGKMIFWKTTNSTAFVNLGTNASFNWSFIPGAGVDRNAKYKGSALSEGTGIYICNTGDEAEMQGAYEFVKFLAQKENQIYWATTIGYVAYSNVASDEYRVWAEENYPSANALMDTLLSSSADLKLPYVVSDILTANSELFSSVSVDPTGDLDTYIKTASDKIDLGINVYNMRKEQ